LVPGDRPHISSKAASSRSATPSACTYREIRLRYSSVSDAIAGSFVFPIHAILIFRGRAHPHFFPEASTTDAPNATFSPSEYRRTAA
jgi:hypothetical protein